MLGTASPLPKAFPSAMRRIDIGGKHLTNFLTELVSYRSLDLSDEPHVVEAMREDVCFVAADCARALRDRAALGVDYVLPDFGDVRRGHVRAAGESELRQGVRLASERVWVPELLFGPAAVGARCAGGAANAHRPKPDGAERLRCGVDFGGTPR